MRRIIDLTVIFHLRDKNIDLLFSLVIPIAKKYKIILNSLIHANMRRIIDLTLIYPLRDKDIDCLFVFLSDNPHKTNGSTNVPFDRFSVLCGSNECMECFDGFLQVM